MKIFQIYYSDDSKILLDPSFIPFDNSKSEYSDWYEYSAIRDIFRTKTFDEHEYIGVLSPKFFSKTGLTGAYVTRFAENCNSDVISFSPQFNHIALFKNPFVQGERWHKGLMKTSVELFKTIGLNVDVEAMVSDQTRTIYSNYFLAKYSFWKEYFKYAEMIFEIAHGTSGLADQLNAMVCYKNRKIKDVALKVFVMERLVTVLLEYFKMDAAIGFSYKTYAAAYNNPATFQQLILLDSLKTLYLKTNNCYYLDIYNDSLRKIFKRHEQH